MRVMQVAVQLAGASTAQSGLSGMAAQLNAAAAGGRKYAAALRAISKAGGGIPNLQFPALPATSPGGGGSGRGSGGGFNVAGPYSRFQQAQSQMMTALQQGTQTQLFDAAFQLRNAGTGFVKAQKGFSFSGPNQRLLKAQIDLHAAIQRGTSAEIRDGEIAVRRAQEALTRANRPAPRQTLYGRLAQLVLSTRINLPGAGGGVGASPLVGRLLAAVGATGGTALAIAGLGVAASVGVTALKAFADTVKAGASALSDAASAATISGGSSGDVGAVRSLGIDSGSIASLAAAVRGARSTDPFAMAQFGYQLPHPFGSTNDAEGLRKTIDIISRMKTSTDRLRAANLANLGSILPLIEGMRRLRHEYDLDVKSRSEIVNGKALQAAQDLAFAQSRLTGNWELFTQAISKPLLPELTRLTNSSANAIRNLSDFLDNHPKEIVGTFNALMTVGLFGPLGQLALLMEKLFPGKGGGSDPKDDAQERLIEALNKLGAIYKAGMYGGGARAAGAIPIHYLGPTTADQMDWRSRQFGAWQL